MQPSNKTELSKIKLEVLRRAEATDQARMQEQLSKITKPAAYVSEEVKKRAMQRAARWLRNKYHSTGVVPPRNIREKIDMLVVRQRSGK